MRLLAGRIIREAAVVAGIAPDAVMDKPDKDTVLLPVPRVELVYKEGTMKKSFARLSKFPTPNQETTHRTIRDRIYTIDLPVQATVVCADESWIESFFLGFVGALPDSVADDLGNLVTVSATRSGLSGFGARMVEVFIKRKNTITVTFSGIITRDTVLPLIRSVDVESGINYVTKV